MDMLIDVVFVMGYVWFVNLGEFSEQVFLNDKLDFV